jgi:hypothetical protein
VGSSAVDGRPGGEGGGAGLEAGDGRVTAAVTELYGADPQEFTDRRKALAAAARAAGDAVAAKQISALRKPTRAAWVVNRLARADPGAPARLASLATALRAAEQARDGPRLRELSAARGPLIDALTGQALATAGVPDPPAGLREEIAATLTAALADPDVAAGFAAGTLTRAAQWAGFGLVPSGPADGVAPPEPPAPGEPLSAEFPPPAAFRPGPAPAPAPLRPRPGTPRRPPSSAAGPAPPTSVVEEAARQAARRQIFEDAERAVATAAAAAADAAAAEDRLEAEVRDLEERLTEARADLAAARLRARHAEAAERRARQTFDRLPRP